MSGAGSVSAEERGVAWSGIGSGFPAGRWSGAVWHAHTGWSDLTGPRRQPVGFGLMLVKPDGRTRSAWRCGMEPGGTSPVHHPHDPPPAFLKAHPMNLLRNIVTATDFSGPSRHAAQRAALLARSGGAALTLLHAVGGSALDDLRRWLADDSEAARAIEADARQRLDALAAELGRSQGLAVQSQVAVGHPAEQVIRHADAVDAGLVVTGTRGAGFFRGVVVGSTAERIAKRASRPVLMVRQLPHEPYRRILVPVDFSDWSRCAVDLARQIAPEATLVLTHAVELPFEGKLRLAGVADSTVARYRDAARQEAQQRLRQLAAEAGLDAGRVQLSTPSGADAWMLIVQDEQEHDCDLVVIGRQGRHAIDEFLLGSTTRMVIAEGGADVLIASGPGAAGAATGGSGPRPPAGTPRP
jgi:nucleotide-binding universal stress UspA family protein